MKYSQLISFNPIEDVIQLVTAGNKDKAREYVKTYVMSDTMADALQAPMIDQRYLCYCNRCRQSAVSAEQEVRPADGAYRW